MIRAIIERHCRPGKERELERLLIELRTQAMHYPGYITGETLQSADDPTYWLVISTWINEGQWIKWQSRPERQKLESEIGHLLISPEEVKIFNPIKRPV